MVSAITVTGVSGKTAFIDVADSADGPLAEWGRVSISEDGTTKVDLDEEASRYIYRVRE